MPAGAAVKQLRKNHLLPGGKHHASEGVVVVVVVLVVVVIVGVGVGVGVGVVTTSVP